MKKIYLLIICICLFTGCTINYDIEIKKNYTVDETITINESKSKLKDPNYSISEIIEAKLESYKDNIEKNNFTSTTEEDSQNIKIILTSKNKGIYQMIKLNHFARMFNGADIAEDKETFSFKTNGHYYHSGLFYDDKGVGGTNFVDKIYINIKFDNEVLECNADKVNKETNTYTWIIDKNTKEKSIEFKLANEKQEENQEEKKEKKRKTNYGLIIMVVVFTILIVLTIYLSIIIKIKNKI